MTLLHVVSMSGAATNVDGAPGTTRIDLGQPLGQLIFPMPGILTTTQKMRLLV
jgi:hypothetical protein